MAKLSQATFNRMNGLASIKQMQGLNGLIKEWLKEGFEREDVEAFLLQCVSEACKVATPYKRLAIHFFDKDTSGSLTNWVSIVFNGKLLPKKELARQWKEVQENVPFRKYYYETETSGGELTPTEKELLEEIGIEFE